MVKIQNPIIARQDKYANPIHILKPLLSENYSMEGRPFILEQFENELKDTEIVFYPSSGIDLNDIIYLKINQHNKLSSVKPSIFMHSDFRCDNGYDHDRDNYLQENSMFIEAKFFYNCMNSQRVIKIYKLKYREEIGYFWHIFFGGYYNEDIVDFFIKHNLKTKIIYTYCDGITHGMGGFNPEPIPTVFYPLLSDEIGVEYILTEQHSEYIKRIIRERDILEIITWLKRTYGVSKNLKISELLTIKNHNDVREKLIELLCKFAEEPLIGSEFNLVLKTIKI